MSISQAKVATARRKERGRVRRGGISARARLQTSKRFANVLIKTKSTSLARVSNHVLQKGKRGPESAGSRRDKKGGTTRHCLEE